MSTIILLAIGALLCFYGIRSVNLALIASGFGIGWLIAESIDATFGESLIWGLSGALLTWLLVSLVFRTATFVVGLATGAVVGAKLWAALSGPDTGVVLMLVVILAVAVSFGTLAEKYRSRVLLWSTALGGASLILSGLSVIPGLTFLKYPDDGPEQVLMLVAWLALGGFGWAVQRRIFAERLGLEARQK